MSLSVYAFMGYWFMRLWVLSAGIPFYISLAARSAVLQRSGLIAEERSYSDILLLNLPQNYCFFLRYTRKVVPFLDV